jgi:hypothetical protein
MRPGRQLQDLVQAPEVVSFGELRSLAGCDRLCITIAFSTSEPGQIHARLRHAAQEAEKRLSALGATSETITDLVGPIHPVAEFIGLDGLEISGLILYRSTDILRYFPVGQPFREFVSVGHRFHVRTLLSLVSRPQEFCVLALSVRNVRLFRCSYRAARQVPLGGFAPQNLESFLTMRMPDHALNRAAFSQSVRSIKAHGFRTSPDRELSDDYITDFFREIDKALQLTLSGRSEPLILAGVQSELAVYRRVSSYASLEGQAIETSADNLTPEELHTCALEIVKRTFSAPLRKVVALFEQNRNAGRVLVVPDEILRAADRGRISTLLTNDSAGWSDADTGRDWLNDAAVSTVLHGGQAFGLRSSEMPNRFEAVAIIRY